MRLFYLNVVLVQGTNTEILRIYIHMHIHSHSGAGVVTAHEKEAEECAQNGARGGGAKQQGATGR